MDEVSIHFCGALWFVNLSFLDPHIYFPTFEEEPQILQSQLFTSSLCLLLRNSGRPTFNTGIINASTFAIVTQKPNDQEYDAYDSLLEAITDIKHPLYATQFDLTQQHHMESAIDLYICGVKVIRLAHKVCDECESGRLPFLYHATFDEFVAMAERLRDHSILGYLDGPLEDLLTGEMDSVLARIHQCAIGYRLRIGRALCDVAPFGGLLESIQAHGHIFPVRISNYLCWFQYLNCFSWRERMTEYISFSISLTSVSSLLIH